MTDQLSRETPESVDDLGSDDRPDDRRDDRRDRRR